MNPQRLEDPFQMFGDTRPNQENQGQEVSVATNTTRRALLKRTGTVGASLAAASLIGSTLHGRAAAAEITAFSTYNEINGQVVRGRTSGVATYLIDQGVRHLIPDELTFNNLFTGWDIITTYDDLAFIDEGAPLSSGAILVRGEGVATWLVTNGVKRPINSEEIMSRYHFDYKKIVLVPQILLDAANVGSAVGP
jgi:hypothetical protein